MFFTHFFKIALHGRAEDYAKEKNFREQFDLCVSRAVSNLSTLSEYCIPYVKIGGHFISYKSEKLSEEKKDAEYAISRLSITVFKKSTLLCRESSKIISISGKAIFNGIPGSFKKINSFYYNH